MGRRPPVLLACLVGAALGLAAGLAGLERLLAYPLSRFSELFPRPVGTLWLARLQGPAETLSGLSLPLRAASIVLLLLALWALARLLNPGLRLLKPPGDNPGSGFGAHLDVPLLLRAGGAVLLTLWLAGLFAPAALLLPLRGPAAVLPLLLLGGVPLWTGYLPGLAGLLLQTLLLGLSLWLIWGPGGPVTGKDALSRKSVAVWGLLAGAAALPAVVAYQASRLWLPEIAPAFTLADAGGWRGLTAATLFVPAAAGVWVMGTAAFFRPRAECPAALRTPLLLALGLALLGAAELALIQSLFDRVDARRPSLARLLGLQGSPLSRMALVLAPDGRALATITPEGTDNGFGRDRIQVDGDTRGAVQRFLEERRYRSLLTFRAFRHLHGCAALDWNTTQALEVDLEMLERAPSPLAASRLLDKLSHCPTTAENRRVLDALADPTRFDWPQPKGKRWLGAAYLRFGDMERAREQMLTAGLSEGEFGQAMGGLSPLPDGTVRGQVTVRGRKMAGVRVGLVRADADSWRPMVGLVSADEWRRVVGCTHTDAEGRFALRGISEGEYLLVVTGGGIGRYSGQATATPFPGVIRLDRMHPERRVPLFDLQWRQPLRVPEDGSPPGIRA